MSRRNKSVDIGLAADEAERLPLFAAEIRGKDESERLPLFADEVRGEKDRETDEARPLVEIGSKVDIMGFKGAEVMDARRIDGVDYELYRNQDGGGVIRVQDADTGMTATPIVSYPEF